MILVILTALTAVCGAAKLDRSYLPPITAKTAGGSPGALLAPLDGSNQGLPTGSYTNDAQGVVVDAVNPGTRTSGLEPSGLGGPRTSYGSTNSKVGDAAFKDATNSASGINPLTRIAPGFESLVASDEADKTRTASLKFTTDVGQDNYSYGFETDNGISVGENGVATNGVQAEGGYSYKGDDGKTYSVTYTADEGGYKPQGHHLPTPPPIPDEILKSLEKNAKEEAVGHVDDGSYDAQKYNDEGDYGNEAGNNNGKPLNGVATASGSFVNQNNQAYRPTSGILIGSYNGGAENAQESGNSQGFGQVSGNIETGFGLNKEQDATQDSNNNIEGQGQFGAKTQFSTENRFKDTANGAGQSFASASASSSPIGGPSFNSLPGSSKINSAFSSAVTTGSGSASAFASTGPVDTGFRNDYLPPNNFESSQKIESAKFESDSSPGASFPDQLAIKPSSSSASASASSSPTFGHSQQFSGSQGESNQNSLGIKFGSEPIRPSSLASGSGLTSVGHSHQFSGSQQTTFNNDNSGFGNEYLPPALGSTSNSISQGVDSHTGSSPDSHTHQSPKFPSSAFASSSVSENVDSQFGQKVNNFPSRLSETQTSQFTSSGSASAKPAGSFSAGTYTQSQSGNYGSNSEKVNIIESTGHHHHHHQSPGKPTHHSKPEGTDSSSAASFNANQFGHHQSGASTGISHSPSASGNFGVTSQQANSGTFNSKPQTNAGLPSSASHSQFGNTNTHFSGVQSNQPSTGFENLPTQGPTKTPDTELTTPFESNYQPSGKIPAALPTPVTTFVSPVQSSQSGSYQSQSTFNSQASGQYRPQSQGSVRPGDAVFASTTQRPSVTQEQGSDDSYYYRQPSKPFITLANSGVGSGSNTFNINNRQPNFPVTSQPQQGSKYSNTPSTSSVNGITQASATSFSSNSPISTTQFGPQPNQFGSKPTTAQFGQTSFGQQGSTQFGATGNQQTFSQKPDTQSTQSTVQTQQYQGTIYEYNKPAETLPATQQSSSFGQVTQTTQSKPSQISTDLDNRFGLQQGSSQFGSQKPFGSGDSSSQSTQITQTSAFAQGGSSQGQSVQSTQFGQKPFGTQTTGSKYQSTQFGVSGSQFGTKPQTNQGTNSFVSNTFSQTQKQQQSQFGNNKPSSTQSYFQQSQFGSAGQKTGSNQGISQTSTSGTQIQTSQTPFGSSTTGSSFQQTQFGAGSKFEQKPQSNQGFGSAASAFSQGQPQANKQPTGSAFQQTQFGLSGSQFGQQQQPIPNKGVSATTSQTSFSQKPLTFSQTGSTFQQSQFGSGSSSFGQKPQTGKDSSSSSTTSQTSFGSSQSGYTYQKPQATVTGLSSTFGQTSFGKKPFGSSQIVSTFPQSQSGLVGSSFAQKQPTGSSVTTSQTSFGQKPFGTSQTGSTFQQSQFGSTSSSAGVGSGLSSTNTQTLGQKPFGTSQTGSNFQQSQFGQKQQSSQGSFPIVTTVKPFEQKPFSSSQTSGSKFQQSQFGLASSSFGQKPQSGIDSSSSSITSQTFSQKPFGASQTASTFQQSQFGQKQQSSQGSFPTVTTVKPFEQKPFSSSQSSGSSFQTGSSVFQTTQKPTSTFGTYSQSSQFGAQEKKPFGSSQTSGSTFQQSQFGSASTTFGQKPQVVVDSSSSPTSSQSSFGSQTGYTYQKPQSTAFGSATISKGQQNTQFEQKPFGASQTGSSFQQSQFSSSTGSQGVGSVGSNAGTNFQNRFGQASQSGQKPFGTLGTYQQSQVGASGLLFGQKPQSSQASAFTSNTATKGETVQTSQSGPKPFGSSQTFGSSFQQNQFASSTGSQTPQGAGAIGGTASPNQFGQTGQKPFGAASTTGSSFQQSQFSTSATGSKFSQTPQTVQGTFSLGQLGSKPQNSVQSTQSSIFQQSQFGQKQQNSQGSFPVVTTVKPFDQKPFGSSQSSGSSFQIGSSRFQTTQKPTFGTYSQTSQFGTQEKKPFGSSQTSQFGSASNFGQKPQSQASALASSSGSDAGQYVIETEVKPIDDSHGSQVSKFGAQNQGTVSIGSQKPFGSSSSQTNYQQSQFSQSFNQLGTPSRFGQGSESNVGNGLPESQSLLGSQRVKPQFTQTYQQSQTINAQKFGISQGSTFQTDQKTQPTQSNVQSTSFTSQNQNSFDGDLGYNYRKPELAFNPVSQLTQDQKTQQSQTSFNSQPSIVGQGTGDIQGQSNFGSQSGLQSTIATGLNGYSGQQFKPASTASATAVSTSQFGVQPTKPTVGFSGQAFQSVSPTKTSVGSQNIVGSTPQFGVRPTQSSIVVTSQKPSQTQFGGESLIASGFSSTQGAFPTPISTINTPDGYQGPGEQFGGPRDPPRFHDKTGYHY